MKSIFNAAATLLGSALGVVGPFGGLPPKRLYGPRVITDKNIGRSHRLKWVEVGRTQEKVRKTGSKRKPRLLVREVIRMAPINLSKTYSANGAREVARRQRRALA